MDSLFLWEVGSPRVYLIWIAVLVAQMVVAEINRRYNWTIFVFWTGLGILLIPYAWSVSTPILGWFPFAKYALMVATATMTGALLVYGKRNPLKAHRYAFWFGVLLWLGLVSNIMEANIRDITIFLSRQEYLDCAADWQCLQAINDARPADMIGGLPETRGVTAPLHSPEWYQAVAENFRANNVGIDPETGFRTIGGWWNIMSAVAGLLNCITVTGLGKIIITSPGKKKVRGLIWIDQVWPWIIAYDLWNHAFLYNALADYTWYCSLALLLACTIPAFTWAKGQWIWFRCFTLMFWIAYYNWFAPYAAPPAVMSNFATMNPAANYASAGAALVFNIAVFIYWAYKVIAEKRNPLTNVVFERTGAFAKVARIHLDDRDKYFVTDMIEATPLELSFSPASKTPPADGYVGYLPWWRVDKRYPKARTPLAADPGLVQRGVKSDPRYDVANTTWLHDANRHD